MNENQNRIAIVAAAAHERFTRACEDIRAENVVLLKEFAEWMGQQGLSEDTLGMHLRNTSFYIQIFLLYEQPLRPHEGFSQVGMYLGYWFIRKGPIATPGTVKTTSTSLIKFCAFLVEKGMVSPQTLATLRKTVRAEMGRWQERARRYNDPTITDRSEIWI